MKRRLALVLASAMLLTSAVAGLASCKSGGKGGDDSKGHVYYLNFKPEQDADWQNLAKLYTEQTGVTVDVFTAAQGTYQPTRATELAKQDAPTLFQVTGPIDLAAMKDYCLDLTDTDVVKELTDSNFTLKSDGKPCAIAYVTETYGMIVNKKLLAEAGHSVDEITNFESFKAVVEDITAQKKAGKVSFSAFTNPSLKTGEDWRIQTHLANLPLYYEYKSEGVDPTSGTKTIKGTYLDNFKQIFDLYINNATCDPAIADSKTVDEAIAEFASGEAVFFQNGSWAYGQVMAAGGEGIGDENLQMIPIYIGAEGEENQGLCIGTENFWAVNKNAEQEDIDATLDFLKWVVTSEEGINALCDDMGFVIPFKNAKEPKNLFVKQGAELTAAGKQTVEWSLLTMPSEDWKKNLGSTLAAYARNQGDDSWTTVKEAFIDNWAAEYALIK